MERSDLLLSCLRVLWGVVTPNVRKVSIGLVGNIITLYFYIDLSEEAATEVITDFSDPDRMIN